MKQFNLKQYVPIFIFTAYFHTLHIFKFIPQDRSTLLHSQLCLKAGYCLNYKCLEARLSLILCLKTGHLYSQIKHRPQFIHRTITITVTINLIVMKKDKYERECILFTTIQFKSSYVCTYLGRYIMLMNA